MVLTFFSGCQFFQIDEQTVGVNRTHVIDVRLIQAFNHVIGKPHGLRLAEQILLPVHGAGAAPYERAPLPFTLLNLEHDLPGACHDGVRHTGELGHIDPVAVVCPSRQDAVQKHDLTVLFRYVDMAVEDAWELVPKINQLVVMRRKQCARTEKCVSAMCSITDHAMDSPSRCARSATDLVEDE